ncbi:CDPK-related protein kinase [Hordeum vulgare]|nr:CDPK-related protein kinase [Hordeum vulgare]
MWGRIWNSGRGSGSRSGGGNDPERGVVGPEDFVADVDAVAAAIAERSVREETERRRHDEKIEDLEWRQAVEANLAAKAKDDEWWRITRSRGRCTSISAAPARRIELLRGVVHGRELAAVRSPPPSTSTDVDVV